jgi:RND family efflux transporter MFP subunit
VRSTFRTALVPLSIAVTLTGCSHQPPPEPLRAVRTVEIRYDKTQETDRYFGSVQSRYEADQAFRVGGKVVSRKVDVGQQVRQGDIIAVLDETDYRLAVEVAQQQLVAAQAQARQAESNRKRLEALHGDGSVSPSDDEKAQSSAQTTHATAEAEARKLELARNRLEYAVLRASQDGVITSVKFEVGQVVAEGQPVVSIAKEGEPEILVNVPEDELSAFKAGRCRAALTSAPDQPFDVVLRELSPQAASTTRTFRARLKPATPRPLPLGASATVVLERPIADDAAARIPASALTQNNGRPAVWVVRREAAGTVGTVRLLAVSVHAYRNDEVLVSGPSSGELVVTAGVQKMAPDLRVAIAGAAQNLEPKQAAR